MTGKAEVQPLIRRALPRPNLPSMCVPCGRRTLQSAELVLAASLLTGLCGVPEACYLHPTL